MPKDTSTFELSLGERPAGVSLHGWLCREIRSAILENRLIHGERLPASRDLATQYGISRGTVVAVYEQLQAEGYVISQVGAGTRVHTHTLQQKPQPQQAKTSTALPRPKRESLAGLPSPQPAMPFRVHEPALDEFPVKLWARLAGRRIRNAASALLAGGGALGYPPLRAAIAAYVGNSRGVRCEAEQVVVVSGVQQALDLLARFLFRPGDRVLVEDPGYFGAVLALRNAGVKLIPAKVDKDGFVVPDHRLAAKGAYLTPGHQFPLGMTMPLDRRMKVLDWARVNRTWLIEDDYDSEYRFEGRPVVALQGLDPAGRVIFVGTFNKLLFPALKLGYFVLPSELVDPFRSFRYATDLQGSGVDQAVLCDFISEGHLSRHIRRTRDLYGARREALVEGVRKYLSGQLTVSPVRAGLCSGAFLQNGMDSAEAESTAAAHGIESLGMHRFCLHCEDPHGLLLGFGAFHESRIRTALIQLAAALEKRN
jgi:GntR family transcriptional regulator/MocR family aminotransferase